jgi:hypothetical protein
LLKDGYLKTSVSPGPSRRQPTDAGPTIATLARAVTMNVVLSAAVRFTVSRPSFRHPFLDVVEEGCDAQSSGAASRALAKRRHQSLCQNGHSSTSYAL